MLKAPPSDTSSGKESNVSYYSKLYPAVFASAQDCFLYDSGGHRYIDFFCAAGSLNYGHNPPRAREALLNYLDAKGVIASLDMLTEARTTFVSRFHEAILAPRNFSYRIHVTAPTGADAVEAALKLARKVTGRRTVAYMEGSFHGVTLGALSVTDYPHVRGAAGIPFEHTLRLPFDNPTRDADDNLSIISALLGLSSTELPAALIVETVQAEGGLRAARPEWLIGLQKLLRERGILLIVDDIQVGCGRTGTFFSFDGLPLAPDIVCLSKSLSGIGIPLSAVLLRPELDVWEPGEHTGTFRGNNLGFVAAAAMLDLWLDESFVAHIDDLDTLFSSLSHSLLASHPDKIVGIRGRGLALGLEFQEPTCANAVMRDAFKFGLMIETSGFRGEVLKIYPPLTASEEVMREAFSVLSKILH
ncbi:4-aminobutyrate aminotransferase family protein (plasmid) [Thioflavicoccus mobilis 8321]|uniref:4-aminobutyrate aminotransferase family protein n=1 Tax=Thioflavicoccus mobilis 8321 TaxID=765912 RepID=L0H022_9GAMM|nr:diaminobutyrate--2-oxoglutarate transaminase [Thioflavicoccus mobilis]AGA92368.1 4-aminobutyrate aminotransferase family protein [Thioflavicoccus mobilis 8321]